MKKSITVWIFIGLGTGILLGLVLLYFTGNQQEPKRFVPEVGAAFPEISAVNLEGHSVRFSGNSGKKVLINFWASWCPPCMDELPYLQEISEKTKDKLDVIGINSDDTSEDIHKIVDGLGLTFPNWIDPQAKISRMLLVSALPTSYILDENGKIQAIIVGQVSDEILQKYIEIK